MIDRLSGRIDGSKLKRNRWGVTSTFQTTNEYGLEVIVKTRRDSAIKPRWFQYTRLRDGIPFGGEVDRERAAFLVSQWLGIELPVPRVVILDIPGVGEAAVSEYTDGMKHLQSFWRRDKLSLIPKQHHVAIALFDAVIGNRDRGLRNVLKSKKGSDWLLIDHAYSFSTEVTIPEELSNHVWMTGQDLWDPDVEALQSLVHEDKFVRNHLVKYVGYKPVNLMYKRIEWMLRAGRVFTEAEYRAGVWASI